MTEVFNIVPASSKPLWVMGGTALVLLLVLGLFGWVAYSSKHTRFEISEKGLHIRGELYGRLVPAKALIIEQAQRVDLRETRPYQPTLRTNGVGLPGYKSGWFKLRNEEKALVFVTDPSSVVYVPTREGYSLLMSVDRPDAFLASIRKLSTNETG